MKNLNLFLAGLFLATFACNQEPGTTEVFTTTIGLGTPYAGMPEVLNGKVKEVTEKIYLAVEQEGEYVKGERMSEEARDTIGWSSSFVAGYDMEGNPLKVVEIDGQDQAYGMSEFEIVEGKIRKTVYSLGDTVRVITNVSYNDEENSATFERIRMPVDTLLNRIHVKYDTLGRYASFKFYNPAGEIIRRSEFTFGEDGESVTLTSYNGDGEITGSRTKVANDHGFAGKDIIVNRAGEEHSYTMEYEYDDMGNWTSRVVAGDDIVVVEERTITYFEEEDPE